MARRPPPQPVHEDHTVEGVSVSFIFTSVGSGRWDWYWTTLAGQHGRNMDDLAISLSEAREDAKSHARHHLGPDDGKA